MRAVDLFENQFFGIYAPLATVIDPLSGIVDGYPDENHSITIDKTTYPVETGARLTDHAIVRPDTVTLEGFVSDIQVAEGSITNLSGPSRAPEAYERIEAIAKAREPISVVTSLKSYENMLILSVDTIRNADTGQALRFRITLEEVQFADTLLVALPPAIVADDGPVANKTSQVNGGRKQSPEDPLSEERLARLQNATGSLVEGA